MTPYIKKIVELHKIHKAIEDKDCNGGGNTPSGDITIDDVVKFIHDNVHDETVFPYTTWDDIPYLLDANATELCKGYNMPPVGFDAIILNDTLHIIGTKAINNSDTSPNPK